MKSESNSEDRFFWVIVKGEFTSLNSNSFKGTARLITRYPPVITEAYEFGAVISTEGIYALWVEILRHRVPGGATEIRFLAGARNDTVIGLLNVRDACR